MYDRATRFLRGDAAQAAQVPRLGLGRRQVEPPAQDGCRRESSDRSVRRATAQPITRSIVVAFTGVWTDVAGLKTVVEFVGHYFVSSAYASRREDRPPRRRWCGPRSSTTRADPC